MLRKILRIPFRVMRKSLDFVRPPLARIGSRNRMIARMYYAFFQPSFGQEQMAFLAGMQAYDKALTLPDGNIALLRRNVHRIEKGILMRPRRVPFALDYIADTVDAYVAARISTSEDTVDLQWAHDVLKEYFLISSNKHPSLCQLNKKFSAQPVVRGCSEESLIPYQRDLNTPPSVSFVELMTLAVRRRSVRWFLQKPVPREIIDRAVEVGAQAPSACNRQPFQFRILDDPELVQEAITIPFGLVGYGHNVPCLVVLVGNQGNYFDERDRHLIYIDGSLAAMGFLLALETQGVSTCCVNWPEIASNDKKMAALLNLTPDERPVMLIALGYPDPEGMVARSTKKSLHLLRHYNLK